MIKKILTAAAVGGLVLGTAGAASAAASPGFTYGTLASWDCGRFNGLPFGYCTVNIREANGHVQTTELYQTTPISRCGNWGVPEGHTIEMPGELRTLQNIVIKGHHAPLGVTWEYARDTRRGGKIVCTAQPAQL